MNWELLYKLEVEAFGNLERDYHELKSKYYKAIIELEQLKATQSKAEESLGLVGTLKAQETPITINIYT